MFSNKIDWLFIATPITAAIFVFYGFVAAAISFALITGWFFAKPVEPHFSAYWPRAAFAASVVLLSSPLLRLIFGYDFCFGAPFAPLHNFAGAGDLLPNTGGEREFYDLLWAKIAEPCLSKRWIDVHWLRDITYPILGAFGLVWSFLKRDREVSM